MIKFSLFRIPVSIHWMFLVLAAFLGGISSAKSADDLYFVLIFMLAAFVSILVHELAHAFAGLKQGAPSANIQLHGMGGLASFPGAQFTRKQGILTSAAGPAGSIALALLAFVLILALAPSQELESSRSLTHFAGLMITINLFWTAINLCPILPLDGGQILRDALGPKRLKLTGIIGFVSVIIIGVLLWLSTRSIYNLILVALLAQHNFQVINQAKRADKSP